MSVFAEIQYLLFLSEEHFCDKIRLITNTDQPKWIQYFHSLLIKVFYCSEYMFIR